MAGLRERNKQEKLTRIRAAAWSLFRAHGYEGTTTRAIAEAAGIGTGTLFLYARDKADLLFLLFRDELEAIVEERFARVPNRPLLEQLLFVFAGFYERYAADPALARHFVRQIIGLEGQRLADYARLNAGFFARVDALVQAARARGEVRDDVDGFGLGVNLLAIYGFLVLGWLALPEPRAADGLAVLRPAIALQLDGVRPLATPVRRPARAASRRSRRAP